MGLLHWLLRDVCTEWRWEWEVEMRILLAFLVGLMGQQLAAAEETVQKYLVLLKNGTLCEKRAAVLFLHRQGKQAIPVLLEHLDDTEIAPLSTLIFDNPALSWMPPGSDHDQPAGELYAYVVELIIAKAALIRRWREHL